jgi:hypothetical protein
MFDENTFIIYYFHHFIIFIIQPFMKQCPICSKTSAMAGTRKLLRGHYNLTKRSRKYPNMQWAPVSAAILKKINSPLPTGTGAKKRVLICAKCIKALSKKL